jgi:8-oxo-dGTP pyrophosphatase MutT (NUDIX family)
MPAGPPAAAPAASAWIGSVAEADLPLLARWPQWFRIEPGEVQMHLPPGRQDAVLAEVHAELRHLGVIRAWRDEAFGLFGAGGQVLAVIERAAARFWGALTLGSHCNGHVLGPDGRPSHLWVARRAWHKPTDPGRLDNLIGGGVPWGQTPRQALVREAWEEAGLLPQELLGLQAGSVLELDCDVPEGRQHEWLHVHDLALPPGRVPVNQDDEVAEHRLMSIEAALAHAAAGDMTTDAALATLDFACRHRLLPPAEQAPLAAALSRLRVPAERAGRFETPA